MSELTQEVADRIMRAAKRLARATIDFPVEGTCGHLQAFAIDSADPFLFDVNRKGTRQPRCTYQERCDAHGILVRLDLRGTPHTNPDGEVVPTPHIHIYHQGFGVRWARPIPEDIFTRVDDFVETLRHFLAYEFCNVTTLPPIQLVTN